MILRKVFGDDHDGSYYRTAIQMNSAIMAALTTDTTTLKNYMATMSEIRSITDRDAVPGMSWAGLAGEEGGKSPALSRHAGDPGRHEARLSNLA